MLLRSLAPWIAVAVALVAAAVFARFGPEEHMQLYGRGIRRRLAPMLGDRPQLELANSLLFSLPGTPVIRYGDEIGMGDDLDLPERDAAKAVSPAQRPA